MNERDTVSLQDFKGWILGTARAYKSSAQISVLLESKDSKELAIVGNLSSKMKSMQNSQPNSVTEHNIQPDNRVLKNSRSRLGIKQVQLVQGAVINMENNCIDMMFGNFHGRRAFFCTTSSGISIFDVEFADFPKLILRQYVTPGPL